MLLDGTADSLVGNINAVLGAELIEKLRFYLAYVHLKPVGRHLHRRVDDAVIEAGIVDKLHLVEVFDHTHHLLAGIGRGVEIQKVVPALERTLEQRAGVAADEAGHVVLADVQ